VAGGAQVGRVAIPSRKWISRNSSPVPSTYQGCLQWCWDVLVTVRGSGVKVLPLFGREKCALQSGTNRWTVRGHVCFVELYNHINNVRTLQYQYAPLVWARRGWPDILLKISAVTAPPWPNPSIPDHYTWQGMPWKHTEGLPTLRWLPESAFPGFPEMPHFCLANRPTHQVF